MLCTKFSANHTHEAHARARARKERHFRTNRTRVLFARVWRVERAVHQRNNLSQNKKLGEPKRVSPSGTLDPRATVTSYMSATGDDAHVALLEECARGFRI
jgi:hypothetical protein